MPSDKYIADCKSHKSFLCGSGTTQNMFMMVHTKASRAHLAATWFPKQTHSTSSSPKMPQLSALRRVVEELIHIQLSRNDFLDAYVSSFDCST